MEGESPYRAPNRQRSEQIIRFSNSFKTGEGTCIDSANKWLKEMSGKVKILIRVVSKDGEGHFREILIWYLELE